MNEKLRKPTRFQEIFESAKKIANPQNLSAEQKKNIFRIFQEQVEATEHWGHFIDEEDLIEELSLIIIGLDVWSKDGRLKELLSKMPGYEHSLIITKFSEPIFQSLAGKGGKYFDIKPESGLGHKGNSRNWYSVHLSLVLGRMILDFI